MGTRHLTCVVKDGEYKVSQYGQFDGYVDGQGAVVLDFLSNKMDKEKFLNKLNDCRFVTEEKLTELWAEYGADGSGSVSFDIADEFDKVHPQLDRNLSAGVLEFIQENDSDDIMLKNDIEFANDSLFCEWLYVIDFDKNVLEVFNGFNQTPTTSDDRFHTSEPERDGDYYPVRLLKSYDLDNLPDEKTFVNECDPDMDEAEDEPEIDFSHDNIMYVIDQMRDGHQPNQDVIERLCSYMEANVDDIIKAHDK